MWHWIPLDGGWGGGGGASSTVPGEENKAVDKSRKRRGNDLRTIEEAICRRLGFPFYGFLLYHSGNPRIRYFLNNHLSILDELSGKLFAIFSLVEKHTSPLRIDDLLKATPDIKTYELVEKWRKNTVPFNPDRCFAVAEGLGIARTSVPCLIIFRASSRQHRSVATLKLKDPWFPGSSKDTEVLNSTVVWMSELFNALELALKARKRGGAIVAFQREMDALSRRLLFYRPIFNALKDGLLPLVKVPFTVVVSISKVLENVATQHVTKTLKSIIGHRDKDGDDKDGEEGH